jgi:exopolysaccharide biosynthesis polyprenyl glycosylphosphotransferase
VSTLLAHPGKQGAQEREWARLIPGEQPRHKFRKKPPQSVTPFPLYEVQPSVNDKAGPIPSAIGLFVPRPLQGPMAKEWIRSITVDFALITLNWLVIGAVLVPLHVVFPRRHLFEFAAGAPVSLIGLAILHAALITLFGYSERLHATGLDPRSEIRIIAKSVLFATGVLCLAYGLQRAPWSMSILFCTAGVFHFGALTVWRREQRLNRSRGETRNVLIIGAGASGRQLAEYFERNPNAGRTVCGFLDDHASPANEIVGSVLDLARVARQKFVDEVILAAPKDPMLAHWVLREARRLRLDVEIVPELFGCSPAVSESDRFGGLPVIYLHAEQLPMVHLALKRLTDVAASGLALILLSPLLALIAVLVKLDSRGPVLYAAQRAGRKGRLFCCYKFRTMVSNADDLKDALRQKNERSGPFFKMTDDPRITRAGHLLRRFSLDELPQLLNVLKGEMSLVGPRPHPLDDVAAYEIDHLARLDVTPGITGLWQVTARHDPSFQRGMELDREYIRTWSLGLDVRILLKTVRAVVQGNGE